MFGKLFKHELSFYAKYFLPILLVFMLIGAVLAPLQFIDNEYSLFSSDYDYSYSPNPMESLQGSLVDILHLFGVLAGYGVVGAFSLAGTILIVVRYYRYFYSSQGYLSFTLPVKVSTHISVKLIVALAIKGIISAACIVFYIATFMLKPLIEYIPQISWAALFNDIYSFFSYDFEYARFVDYIAVPVIIVQLLVSLFFGAVFSIIWYYVCITLGQAIWHKHRILTAIAVYIAGSILYGISENLLNITAYVLILVSSFTTIFNDFMIFYVSHYEWTVNLTLLFSNVVSLTMIAAGLFILWYCMKRRLNL